MQALTLEPSEANSSYAAHLNQREEMTAEAAYALYQKGDYTGALALWLPLADAGDVESQAWIGTLYENGQGVEVNDAEAFRWYLRSAEGGNRLAQNNIGAMYGLGKGVEQDYSQAAKWFERAAEQGDTHSMFNLAVLYSKGKGIAQDIEKAVHWYTQAAERGHVPAQARLGYLYCGNEGVKKDRVSAFVWLTLAGNHGTGHALNALEPLIEQMSMEEKQEAQQLIARFHSRRVLSDNGTNPIAK